jgi:hypothetical protein
VGDQNLGLHLAAGRQNGGVSCPRAAGRQMEDAVHQGESRAWGGRSLDLLSMAARRRDGSPVWGDHPGADLAEDRCVRIFRLAVDPDQTLMADGEPVD